MQEETRIKRLLIVEDDENLRTQLRWSFEGYEVLLAENRAQAIAAIRRSEPAVVLQDLGLPPDAEGVSEGFATLAEILELAPRTKVIVVTGSHDRDRAVRAVALGAYDFYEKPVDIEILRFITERAFHISHLEAEVERLSAREGEDAIPGIVTADPVMLKVCRTIEKVAPADVGVLILGESGTGKELLARAVHDLSGRKQKRFVAINCAAIPEQLLEAELFGYEKGAFTGAVKTTPGKIECADGGTLFLDEIGDMPMALQAKLLRFLQNKVVERVGGRQEIPVDVRIVAATHQNLEKFIGEQKFREDFYYRLSEVTIKVPPLRERTSDVVVLGRAFLKRFSATGAQAKRGFTEEAVAALRSHAWPGNVRELENKIKVACLLGDGMFVSAADLGLAASGDVAMPLNLKEVRARAESDAVRQAMSATGGNISKAAEMLGVSRPTLYDLLARLGFDGHERSEAVGGSH